jgi:hypothetical protein
MFYVEQPQNADDRPDATVPPAVVGQAMIERAKSVVVLAQRVGEDEAAEILLAAACKADIPVRLAADQVMEALEADECRDGITHDTLMRALAAVRPVPQPHPTGTAA